MTSRKMRKANNYLAAVETDKPQPAAGPSRLEPRRLFRIPASRSDTKEKTPPPASHNQSPMADRAGRFEPKVLSSPEVPSRFSRPFSGKRDFSFNF